jgi:hypothetical protein
MIINDVITNEEMKELIEAAAVFAHKGDADMMRLIFEYGLDKTIIDCGYGNPLSAGIKEEKKEVERDCLIFRLINDGEEIEVENRKGEKIEHFTYEDCGKDLIRDILRSVELVEEAGGNVKIIEDDDDEYDDD